jgi:mannose-6-phosphate isomerase-like protein (cupin superfamily)
MDVASNTLVARADLRCNAHMRNYLLLLSLSLAGTASLLAQTPAATTPPATTPTPAAAAPTTATGKGASPKATGTRGTQPTKANASSAAAARGGIAMTITDMKGTTLNGVQVELVGPTPRREGTNAGGQVNFPSLQVGTYLLKFSGDNVTPFEKEVTIPAGKVTSLDITLNPAPPPKEIVREVRVPAPAPAAAVVGPAGMPQITSLYDLAQNELKSKTPRAETLVACSGNLRSTLVIVSKDQPQRLYDSAEASYYVLGGEATFRVGGDEKTVPAGGYMTVPRGVPFSIAKHGNKQLALLALLSGAPCEEAK